MKKPYPSVPRFTSDDDKTRRKGVEHRVPVWKVAGSTLKSSICVLKRGTYTQAHTHIKIHREGSEKPWPRRKTEVREERDKVGGVMSVLDERFYVNTSTMKG